MSFNDIMNKVRYYDNMLARWLMRHFYFMFFQVILAIIFAMWFHNLVKVIDLSHVEAEKTLIEQILLTQTINSTIIVILLILNSFWMLYIFNGMQRLSNLLKEVSYNISRLRVKNRSVS